MNSDALGLNCIAPKLSRKYIALNLMKYHIELIVCKWLFVKTIKKKDLVNNHLDISQFVVLF